MPLGNGSNKPFPSLPSNFLQICPSELSGDIEEDDFLLLEEWVQDLVTQQWGDIKCQGRPRVYLPIRGSQPLGHWLSRSLGHWLKWPLSLGPGGVPAAGREASAALRVAASSLTCSLAHGQLDDVAKSFGDEHDPNENELTHLKLGYMHKFL